MTDKDGGLGLDVGSREGSHMGGRAGNDTPTLANGQLVPSDKSRRNGRGVKRARADGEEDDESDEGGQEDGRPAAKRNVTGNGKKIVSVGWDQEPGVPDSDPAGGDMDVDSTVYCVCQRTSYGEMIGCDDDDCEFEWVSDRLVPLPALINTVPHRMYRSGSPGQITRELDLSTLCREEEEEPQEKAEDQEKADCVERVPQEVHMGATFFRDCDVSCRRCMCHPFTNLYTSS